jgi:hypothetical protein
MSREFMTDSDRIRRVLLEMDCGLITGDRNFRDYLDATLELRRFRSRFKDRNIRRWIWHFKLALLLTLFGVLAMHIFGRAENSAFFWLVFIAIGSGIATTLSDHRKEQICRHHFECVLQLSVEQVPGRFPYEWQAGATVDSLKKYSDGMEWELEWGLRRRELRTVFLLVGGLLLYLYLTFESCGGAPIPYWGCVGQLG